MKAKLLLFKLKVKSSYNQNVEQPADKSIFDTLQFFIQDKTIFRIKTFAIDHDIHIHGINLRGRTVAETIDFLITSTKAHYGNSIEKTVSLEIKDFKNHEEIKSLLKKEGFSPHLDIRQDFFFWNPYNEKYHTQSNPL